MKPHQAKDSTQPGGLNGRKTSLSQITSNFGFASPPLASRPGTRRRETTEGTPFPAGTLTSPSANRIFIRDETDLWFSRKDVKDNASIEDPSDDPVPLSIAAGLDSRGSNIGPTGQPAPQSATNKPAGFPFGSLGRSNTTVASMVTNASLWGASPTSAAGQSSMAFGNFALPGAGLEKAKFTSLRESRFANLMGSKESGDGGKNEAGGSTDVVGLSWRPRARADTDPFGGDEGRPALNHPSQHEASPQMPHSALEQPFDISLKGSAADFGMSGINVGNDDNAAPISPCDTNPYRSPAGERGTGEEESVSEKQQHNLAISSDAPASFGTLGRSFAPGGLDGSDRSQSSSAGPSKGLSGFPTAMGGWPSGPSVGTPDRDRQFSAFGGLFGAPGMTDIHSPPSVGVGLGGIFNNPSGPVGGSTGSLRSNKLSSILPSAMGSQTQDYGAESLGDSVPDLRNPIGSMGRSSTFGHDADGAMRPSRGGTFDGLFANPEMAKQTPIGTQAPGIPGSTVPAQEPGPPPSSNTGGTPPAAVRQMVMPDRMRWVYLDPQGNTQGPFTGLEMNDWYKGNFFSPDLRIKKVEDPEFEPLGHLIRRIGNSREPFLVPQVGIPHGPPPQQPFGAGGAGSGVIPPLPNAFPQFGRVLPAEEQNNLERRKQEEQMKMARQREYFAQHQAINKMGMGTMSGGALHHHSSAQSLQSQPSFGSISSPVGLPPPGPIGAGIPPPAAPAAPAAPAQTSNVSASDDFFGMPTGATQPPAQSGMGSSSLNLFIDDTAGHLTLDERKLLVANLKPSQAAVSRAPDPQQTASAMVQGPGQPLNTLQTSFKPTAQAEPGLRSQLPRTDQLEDDNLGYSARLREFEEYQKGADTGAIAQHHHHDAPVQKSVEVASDFSNDNLVTSPTSGFYTADAHAEKKRGKKGVVTKMEVEQQAQPPEEQLSLTQRVQKAQAAKQSVRDQPAWAKPQSSGLPMPFPPPISNTPLPAPTAQRTRSTLPDQFNRSPSETPETVVPQSVASQAAPPPPPPPPPLAPWAREPTDSHHKGPSLKEIQEAEALKAAQAEELAAAARKAALEQEAIREREKAAASNPILPTNSTWGHTSPVGGTSVNAMPNAWNKPGVIKGALSGIKESQPLKKIKNLAEIQREEEARKKKELAGQPAPVSSNPAGKSYATLASKQSQASPAQSGATSSSGGGWTTVSAGGKAKIPTVPAAQTRTGSAPKTAPLPTVRTSAQKATGRDSKLENYVAAKEEFKKWVTAELKRGMVSGIDASILMDMPIDDPTLISDIVYQHSSTIDGHHFAEEFVRRKRLADKGIVEKSLVPVPQSAKSLPGGGWNEVAKKGGHSKSEASGSSDLSQNSNFKVVSRRKGKK